MKKLVALTLLGLLSSSIFAQDIDLRRKIDVTGNAEQEVTPDIIYMAISLKEYYTDNNNKNKVSIDALEKQLYDAAMKAGIKPEDFMINNISGYNYPDPKKKKDPGFLASKQYRLKVSDLNAFNTIMDAVADKGIQSTNIDGYDHSRIDEFKKELKIKALKDAREKASYLAETLGNKIGKVLFISENGNNENYPQPVMMYRSNAMAAQDMAAPEIDFKKIKLKYNIRAVFELL